MYDLSDFANTCEQQVSLSGYPLAESIVDNLVQYDGGSLRRILESDEEPRVRSEFIKCLREGPGVLLIRNGFERLDIVDEMTRLFEKIILGERTSGQSSGDHFGSNERIWNSLQKTCIDSPALAADYFGNPLMHLISRAWLGPNYQVTAQVNNVKPGGAAQKAHRDYHLGFQTAESVREYPLHVQVMSQCLTLQGAVAHVDMPRAKGPTLLLPFSQQFPQGYMAYHEKEFESYFRTHCVQPELTKGDMLFFNPAVFHAGGANATDSDRMANLLQVSSAFGRTMESLCYRSMIGAIYPLMQSQESRANRRWTEDVLATFTAGYSFPTNLDFDPPKDARPPGTQRDLVRQAIHEEWSMESLNEQLDQLDRRRKAI